MQYIYETAIYTDTTNVIGVDPVTEASNKLDFETNYKSQTVKVDSISIAQIAATIIKTYANFKSLVSGDLTWADVKRHDDTNHYSLYLITDAPL